MSKPQISEPFHKVEGISPDEYPIALDLLFNFKWPRLAALISLLVPGFGGVGQLLLGQETKAGVLFLFEWLVVLPLGYLSATLPFLLLLFHVFTALDVWVIAGRLQRGRVIGKWECLWNKA
jgi:hypothetical protein